MWPRDEEDGMDMLNKFLLPAVRSEASWARRPRMLRSLKPRALAVLRSSVGVCASCGDDAM
eukprot:6278839-Pyramimonas_sp.AAC.1